MSTQTLNAHGFLIGFLAFLRQQEKRKP